MKKLLVLVFLFAIEATAAESPTGVGQVSFANSGSPAAQAVRPPRTSASTDSRGETS